ncbi:MAG: ankyrin repeat domain-containing protein [Rickettsiaceae bacterium]|nr:ankyrin repeat domain-containing protein [Rickettsiaceae bacterium]
MALLNDLEALLKQANLQADEIISRFVAECRGSQKKSSSTECISTKKKNPTTVNDISTKQKTLSAAHEISEDFKFMELALDRHEFKDHLVQIFQLLMLAGCNLCARTKDRSTILHKAAIKNATSLIKLLKEAGNDINDQACEYTPLHLAVGNGHFEFAKVLVDLGAETDLMTPFNQTAYEIARTVIRSKEFYDKIEPKKPHVNQPKKANEASITAFDLFNSVVSSIREGLDHTLSNLASDENFYLKGQKIDISFLKYSQENNEWEALGKDIGEWKKIILTSEEKKDDNPPETNVPEGVNLSGNSADNYTKGNED